MEAMSASISRLCQMVHDAGLRPGNEERLQVVLLEAARARGRLDDSFVSLFDEVLVVSSTSSPSSRSSRTTLT